MKIQERTTDNAALNAGCVLHTRRTVALGAARGLLLGTLFPAIAVVLDFASSGLPFGWSSVVQVRASNPVHGIVELAPFVLALAGARIAHGRANLERHRASLEDSVREQTATLMSFATDLNRKNVELSRANRANESARARFEQMFLGLPIAAFTLDSEGRIAYWNAEAERLYSLPAADVVGRLPDEVLPYESHPRAISCALEDVLRGVERRAKADVVLRPDGSRVSVLCNTFPLFAADGQLLGAVSTATDTSALKAMEEALERQLELNEANAAELVRVNLELRAQAVTDGLTGLKNHRAFQDHLREASLEAAARGKPLSLLMLDADDFKQYNDAFGHPSGDAVLQALAKLIASHTRPLDFAARYGGEEFAVLLHATDSDEAMVIAERLRAGIADAPWEHRPLTVSVGVATQPPNSKAAALVEAADRALYQAKARGRNCCVHVRELESTPRAAIRTA